jgi:hypothetical protein
MVAKLARTLSGRGSWGASSLYWSSYQDPILPSQPAVEPSYFRGEASPSGTWYPRPIIVSIIVLSQAGKTILLGVRSLITSVKLVVCSVSCKYPFHNNPMETS